MRFSMANNVLQQLILLLSFMNIIYGCSKVTLILSVSLDHPYGPPYSLEGYSFVLIFCLFVLSKFTQ